MFSPICKQYDLNDIDNPQVKNRDYFEPYITEDFDKYIARKKHWNVHGNHLEIQAISEMYNRTIEVYCYQIGLFGVLEEHEHYNTILICCRTYKYIQRSETY